MTRLHFYFGTPGWGWKIWGLSYGNKWLIGLSIRNDEYFKENKQ